MAPCHGRDTSRWKMASSGPFIVRTLADIKWSRGPQNVVPRLGFPYRIAPILPVFVRDGRTGLTKISRHGGWAARIYCSCQRSPNCCWGQGVADGYLCPGAESSPQRGTVDRPALLGNRPPVWQNRTAEAICVYLVAYKRRNGQGPRYVRRAERILHSVGDCPRLDIGRPRRPLDSSRPSRGAFPRGKTGGLELFCVSRWDK